MSIRVVVVDDDAMVRSGLSAILGAQDDIDVVGEAEDGVGALGVVRSTEPDVVVMDVRMPRLDGIETTRHVLRDQPGVAVLVITTFEHDSYALDALHAGAAGFLLKRAGASSLVHAVRTVATGDAVLFPTAIRDLVLHTRTSAAALPELSEREQQVLRLLAKGLSNAEIGARLFIGVETVKTYVAAILAKLGVRDRTQAVVAAYESGFVRPGEVTE